MTYQPEQEKHDEQEELNNKLLVIREYNPEAYKRIINIIRSVYEDIKRNGNNFHNIRGSEINKSLCTEIDEIYRNILQEYSLQGTYSYYIKPTEENLEDAMNKYTTWLDEKNSKFQKIDKTIDQVIKNEFQ